MKRSYPADQHLAAPDGPVGAVAGAVEGEADDQLAGGDPVLGHDRGDVGVMVLDEGQPPLGVVFGPVPGVVAGVQVGGQIARA